MRPVIVILLICLLAYHALAKLDFDEPDEYDTQKVGGYDAEELAQDPCRAHHCGVGHECDIDENENPVCVCKRECAEVNELRLQVCSTQNVTFASECELHRQKCLCHKKQDGCLEHRYRHAHVDYFGECREQELCGADEMEEYPGRLRDWLFLIMQELSDRHDLPRGAQRLAQEAKQSSKRWVLPAIWKFCDLDISHDRLVSPQEIVPLTAPLKAMEHCTAPFLQKCDVNRDNELSLDEWGECLGMDRDEIQDRCDEFKN